MRMGSRCLGALFISTNVEMWKTQKKFLNISIVLRLFALMVSVRCVICKEQHLVVCR